MRENKFRLVSKRDNFIYTYRGKPFILDINNIHTIEVLAENHAEGIIPLLYSVEQYTGCKDKNGKEIYEGDTIKYQDRDYSEVFGQGDVYYDSDDCMFKIRCNSVILFFMNLLNEELEVVGNIHDKE